MKKINVLKDEWMEVPVSEIIVSLFATWIKWAVGLWFSTYIIAYTFAHFFIDYAQQICSQVR